MGYLADADALSFVRVPMRPLGSVRALLGMRSSAGGWRASCVASSMKRDKHSRGISARCPAPGWGAAKIAPILQHIGEASRGGGPPDPREI
jgi:hypothetical protein